MQLKITARNVEQASAELKALVRRVEDLRPVLAEFGIHMIRSVEQTFQAGGRPTAWPPSIRAMRGGGKTLIKTARLKNSIVATVTGPRSLSVGTNVKYAAVHQLGFSGTVQIPEHIRRVKSRNVYRVKTATTVSGRKIRSRRKIASGFAVVKAHPAHMRIPARPFLVAQDEDMEILKGMLERHIEGDK
ncbi:MAG: phage virion morphogenesis protein [Candidatus Rokubacteria bacterium]|nr:phage virion morphogenesis protein [Candidatus Rokubacteria bacterium]